jgi:hypothetical protein
VPRRGEVEHGSFSCSSRREKVTLPDALSIVEGNIRDAFFVTDHEAMKIILDAYKEREGEIRELKEALVQEKLTFVNNGRLRQRIKEIGESVIDLNRIAVFHGVDGSPKEKIDEILTLVKRSAAI